MGSLWSALGSASAVVTIGLTVGCVPVSECGYEREEDGKVIAGPKIQAKTEPFERKRLTDVDGRWSACANLCTMQIGRDEFDFGGVGRAGRSPEGKACMSECEANGELYHECRQVGTDWPTFGIPY